jgi:sodium/potassium-transporting ATPase subunit alpha
VISCQMFNGWTMRSWEFSAFSLGIFSNCLMVAGMAVNLVWVWALLNVRAVQKIFNTAHVPLADLWILLPFPVLLFVSHEGYKWLLRRRNSLGNPQPDHG